jgi:hypothetical protein
MSETSSGIAPITPIFTRYVLN